MKKPVAIQFIELSTETSITNSDIRERARESSKSRLTRQYVVLRDGKEIAFVAIDRIRDLNTLVLYEIFVPKSLRGAGLGTSLVHEVEYIARAEGYDKVTLTASPLERGFPRKRLEEWYFRLGYRKRGDEMKKSLEAKDGSRR